MDRKSPLGISIVLDLRRYLRSTKTNSQTSSFSKLAMLPALGKKRKKNTSPITACSISYTNRKASHAAPPPIQRCARVWSHLGLQRFLPQSDCVDSALGSGR